MEISLQLLQMKSGCSVLDTGKEEFDLIAGCFYSMPGFGVPFLPDGMPVRCM